MKRPLAVLCFLILGCYLAECRTTQENSTLNEVYVPKQACNVSAETGVGIEEVLDAFGLGPLLGNNATAIFQSFVPTLRQLWTRFTAFAKPWIERFQGQVSDIVSLLQRSPRSRRCLENIGTMLSNIANRVNQLLSDGDLGQFIYEIVSTAMSLPQTAFNNAISLGFNILKTDVFPLIQDIFWTLAQNGLVPGNIIALISTIKLVLQLLQTLGYL